MPKLNCMRGRRRTTEGRWLPRLRFWQQEADVELDVEQKASEAMVAAANAEAYYVEKMLTALGAMSHGYWYGFGYGGTAYASHNIDQDDGGGLERELEAHRRSAVADMRNRQQEADAEFYAKQKASEAMVEATNAEAYYVEKMLTTLGGNYMA
ncbi:hypothetical protein EJ110_NYTH11304 [Nymphaea thermarum]|nr:hypothetical protein EJ110_NYTH11304 [Nymphaea thermarum]